MSVTPSVGPSIPTAAPPTAPSVSSSWTAGRIVSLVVGCILGLVSLGLLGAGGWATYETNQRDASGYLMADKHAVATSGYAVTSAEVGELAGQSWSDLLGNVRVRATPTDPSAGVFIGVAPKAAVDSYLAGIGQTVVTGWFPFKSHDLLGTGTAPKTGPTATSIWTHQVSGTGTQTLTWKPASNSVVVIMRPDGAAGVSNTVDIGAKFPDLVWFAVGFWAAGVLLLGAAVLLVALPAIRSRR